MFTGIITHLAKVITTEKSSKNDLFLTLRPQIKLTHIPQIGCSISCNGICLTLTKFDQKTQNLSFFASDETISKSNISSWNIGNLINIEFALKMGDELGGHLVSGHVDNVISLLKKEKINEDSWKFTLAKPKNLAPFIAPKGSIVLNGVSLTINEVLPENFSVNIIKHTFCHTNFSDSKIGDKINIEIDIIARYVAQILKNRQQNSPF